MLYRVVCNCWMWFLAYFHMDDWAVCEMSKNLGPADYHDYGGTEEGRPYHFHTMSCKRCGKKFVI